MLLVLPANVRLDWKVSASYKHSSLFDHVVSDKGKKFYNFYVQVVALEGVVRRPPAPQLSGHGRVPEDLLSIQVAAVLSGSIPPNDLAYS